MLHLLIDLDDAKTLDRQLRAQQSLCDGVVVCEAAPGSRTLYALAHDLLQGLGKDDRMAGAARNGQELWSRALIWLLAEQIRHLVVLRAQLLDARRWRRLIEAASVTGAELWLIASGQSLSRGQREVAAEWPLRQAALDDVVQALARRSSTTAEEPAAAAPVGSFPALPDDDFTTFRATCRELLDERDFTTVDTLYQHAASKTQAWLNGRDELGENEVAGFLRGLVAGTCCAAEAVASLRAAQAVFFVGGYHVKVDPCSLAPEPAAPGIEPAEVEQLRRYSKPRYAALAALRRLWTGPIAAICELRLCDVDQTGAGVRLDGQELLVPSAARPLLRAQLLARAFAGAPPDAPLFADEETLTPGAAASSPTAKALQTSLRIVARETGMLGLSMPPRLRAQDRRWRRRSGVSVVDLCSR